MDDSVYSDESLVKDNFEEEDGEDIMLELTGRQNESTNEASINGDDDVVITPSHPVCEMVDGFMVKVDERLKVSGNAVRINRAHIDKSNKQLSMIPTSRKGDRRLPRYFRYIIVIFIYIYLTVRI